MAESAVSSSINLLGKILVEEGKYLWGAEQKVKELQKELLWMRSFLRKADAVQHKDEIVWMWVCEVQEYVYEAEDVIDKFVIKVVSQRRQNGWRNKMIRYSCLLKELYALHQAASSIDSLKVKISMLTPKLKEYGLIRSIGVNTDHYEELQDNQLDHIQRNVHVENKNIIGLQKNAKEIIKALTNKKLPKTFHAIYGMGGLGKTTLATKVLHHDEVKKHFPGGQAFAYVSKKFKAENVIRDVLQQLDSNTSLHNLSINDLEIKLREVLKTKCLIVLDDVWTKQGWDSLKLSFTSWGGDKGSKLLITTRKEEVAKYVDDEALQKPDALNDEESLQLLLETMRWDPSKSSTHEQGIEEKEELVKKMLKVCKGLPLSIVVLGGILRKRHTVSEWKSILNDISSHLLTGYDHGRSCMEIVLQSYDDLTYHLKPLFLHLAIFPEDYEIETQELYSMWIGEGLVTRSGFGGAGARSKSAEDVANVYLRDLAEAGFVQVVESSDGWINSIRIHDLVRDVCLEKASTDNLVMSFDQHQFNKSLSSDNYYNDKMLLRMVISFEDYSLMKDCITSNSKHLNCIRSLILTFDGKEGAKELMRCISNAFQLLRVLVLRKLYGTLSSEIGKLVHLRYLSLRGSTVKEISPSIDKLKFLEILDLKVEGEVLVIPNTLWKLFRLRQLLLPGNESGYEIKGGGKLRVDTLINLETIEDLTLYNLQLEGLLVIKNLRNFSIRDPVCKEAAKYIIPLLKTSPHLQHCKFIVSGEVVSENPGFLSFDVCKFKLWIKGEIGPPENVNLSLPTYLVYLSLFECELKDDPMGILGRLPHLQDLCLDTGCYAGTEMRCESSSFPLVATLEIKGLKKLKVWEAKYGFMPKLVELRISGCIELCRIPDRLPSSLQTINLDNTGRGPMPKNTECGAQIMNPYCFGDWLGDAVLSDEDKPVVVIFEKPGAGKATCAMKLFDIEEVYTGFDVVATTSRSSSSAAGRLLPRPNLEELLRDLSSINRDKEELSQMSTEEVTAEIQQVMQQRKCLVILPNLKLEVDGSFEEQLNKTFGHRHASFAERGSKLVITSPSDDAAASSALIPVDYQRIVSHPLNLPQMEADYSFDLDTEETEREYIGNTNAGIVWNMKMHHSGQPLSFCLLMALLVKENFTEWLSEHKKMMDDENPMDFQQLFDICYDDLQPQLRRYLVFLASFSHGVQVSSKEVCEMLIAAGFFEIQQDDESGVQNTEETIKNLTEDYAYVLLLKGMITWVRVGYQVVYALRDMCLARAKEDPMLNALNLVDLKSLISPSSSKQQFSSAISIPRYDKDNWEWLLYICKHFKLMRVLNVEGMWSTEGRLPEEVGGLTHLTFLSLRQTWVTQLPSSLENLTHLQTLDLRVKETIVVPDVLWKLKCLVHLYLPQHFLPQQTPQLQLSGLSCLQTLVNLDTDKVVLKHFELNLLSTLSVRNIHEADAEELADKFVLRHLSELKLLKRLSIRKIHGELPDIVAQLGPSLELCINSQIINDDPTILATKFHYLKKLKIKGTISIELKPEIFPSELEELTLKHTRLEEDPLAILEKLPKLTQISLDHESFLGKEMNFSNDFRARAYLRLYSLINLETVHTTQSDPCKLYKRIYAKDCLRLRSFCNRRGWRRRSIYF